MGETFLENQEEQKVQTNVMKIYFRILLLPLFFPTNFFFWIWVKDLSFVEATKKWIRGKDILEIFEEGE